MSGGLKRSTSPPPRSPFGVNNNAGLSLGNQLNNLSLKGSPSKGAASSRPLPSHSRTKSSHKANLSIASSTRNGSASPQKKSSNGKQHGSITSSSSSSATAAPARSARSSPVKSSGSNKTGRTPSKQRHAAGTSSTAGASSSLGTSTSRSSGAPVKDSNVVLAGGLGRMDIVSKDWDRDGLSSNSSNSAESSPHKKRSQSANRQRYDRFIPSRGNSAASGTIEDSQKSTRKPDDSVDEGDSQASGIDGWDDDSPHNSPHRHQQDSSDQAHTAELSSSLGIDLGRRILSFSAEPPAASNEHSALLAAYARGEAGARSQTHQSAIAASQRRRIATTPERVLDAPGLVDDYYLNLLDWSASNLLAIALAESVYIWNAETGEVGCLCSVNNGDEESEEIVCSVRFSEDGSYLAVGTASGLIHIYDLSTSSRIRTMSGHATRVPTLSWSGAILSSGSRDGAIWNSDVRVANHKVGEMRGHRAEVCGLEWRKDTGLSGSAGGASGGGQGLLASGGNDNIVNVWDGRMLSAPKMVKSNHTAAVKAIAWCPWQSSLLATGGGSSDRTIHFWNTTTSARLNSLVTPSQVTSLVFNPHSREILSSHGFPDHQLSIWSFPSLTKVVDISQAHETRVLHSCLSPDGTTVATASSDENLKFWKVFDLPKKSSSSSASSAYLGKGNTVGGEGSKHDTDIGRRGRTGLAIR